MPSLLWQLHHSEDSSNLNLDPDCPSSSRQAEQGVDVPSFDSAYRDFLSKYPSFESTSAVDDLRESEYPHLASSNRVCFDYCGFGLFTYSQRFMAGVGPERSDFALSSSASSGGLHAQAVFSTTEPGTLQSALRSGVLQYLGLEDSHELVFTASKRAAFSLVAECYSFHARSRLVTVYDHESESIKSLVASARQAGARTCTAKFRWPSLRICGDELAAELKSKRSKRSKRGLFVFPTQSRITGTKYSYQWMNLAEKYRWDVLLDVSAMGPRDMGSLGLSLFRPDFIICSFYKVFGADPTGFGCLLIKKSSMHSLRGGPSPVGLVRIGSISVPEDQDQDQDIHELMDATAQSVIAFSGPVQRECEIEEVKDDVRPNGVHQGEVELEEDDAVFKKITRDEGLIDSRRCNLFPRFLPIREEGVEDNLQSDGLEGFSNLEETSNSWRGNSSSWDADYYEEEEEEEEEYYGSWDETQALIICRGLDHANSIGLNKTNCRVKSLMDWLITSLGSLLHHAQGPRLRRRPVVQVFGPKAQIDRGPAVAFNIYDHKGVLIQPSVVQKLADRSCISLGCGCLSNLYLEEVATSGGNDKEVKKKKRLPEKCSSFRTSGGGSSNMKRMSNLPVLTATLGFVSNFEDVYRLWAFAAKFVDPEFVAREVLHYQSLNQEVVLLGDEQKHY